jgi:quinol monooxygenase YgiN
MADRHGNSDTVTLLITVLIRPEYEQTFLEYMETYARTVTENEPEGAVLYCLLKEPNTERTYVMLQRYASHAAHDAHKLRPYRAEGLAKLKIWCEKAEFRMLSQVIPK